MEANLYRQSLNGPIRWIAVAAALLIWGSMLPLAMKPGWGGTAAFVIVGLILAALLSMRASILVGPEDVTISVMGMTETIEYSQIKTVEVGPATGAKEGAGARFLKGPNGMGYIVGGPTVRITTRTTDYLVSAQRPDEVVRDITSRMATAR
ncbi:hypothetical protein JKI95_10290 [Corynebacterium aquatimens]|uniref:hypothetical protein n=1 Tax=Corynebacterium TaxID=1716 RepID=UPI001F35CB5B|nr:MULTISPECIES: hypothetical protein [Corynebacterium]QYH19459.1 hypothetical protein JKI95_10290 [Corynebacterium aquatimens]UIZ91624.1 hypothetical protein JZY91_07675 [Corynebacterium sp. CNCTC7651]